MPQNNDLGKNMDNAGMNYARLTVQCTLDLILNSSTSGFLQAPKYQNQDFFQDF